MIADPRPYCACMEQCHPEPEYRCQMSKTPRTDALFAARSATLGEAVTLCRELEHEMEEIKKTTVPLSVNGKSVFIDGIGEVPLDFGQEPVEVVGYVRYGVSGALKYITVHDVEQNVTALFAPKMPNLYPGLGGIMEADRKNNESC